MVRAYLIDNTTERFGERTPREQGTLFRTKLSTSQHHYWEKSY